ncbi:hypothetical protein AAVH_29404 [Aphelenchoides avenae]|nr:hypothetical protein AAVH_29404 [Aphelenchus avenae]
MGTEIGKHPLEPMDFIPSYLYGDQLFKFIRFVDYIDPEPESCENPIEERHYLIEWETPNGSVLQWTHCENITDHRSGMQDMYEIVKRHSVAAALANFDEKCRSIQRLQERIRNLKKAKRDAQVKCDRMRQEVEMLQDMRDREGDVFDGQLRKVRNENDDLKERLSKAESALAALQSERDDLAFLANGQIENTDEGADNAFEEIFSGADEIVNFSSPSPAPIEQQRSAAKRAYPWDTPFANPPKKPNTGGEAMFMRRLPNFADTLPRSFSSASRARLADIPPRTPSSASTRSGKGDRLTFPAWFKTLTDQYPDKRNWMIKIFNWVRWNHRRISDERFKMIFMEKIRKDWQDKPKKK